MLNYLKNIVLATILTSVLAGCVNLKAPVDPTRYYLLNGTTVADSMVISAMGPGPVVRLAPIELDPYLDSRYMVLRLQAYEVQFSDIHRWGEELNTNIQRALASDILATGAVSKVVVKASEDSDYVIRVHIHRFEGVPPDIAHLSATWSLLDSKGNVVHSSTHDDRNRGWVFENYGHLAEKLDESLTAFAQAMVERLPG